MQTCQPYHILRLEVPAMISLANDSSIPDHMQSHLDLEIQGEGMERALSITIENSDEPAEHKIWCSAIQEKIKKQAQLGAEQSTPPYFQRYDAIGNPNHPSIFKLHGESNTITVAAIGPYHRSAPARQPIITDEKKSRIVMFLAEHHGLNTSQFLRWVRMEEARARSCYERGSFDMEARDFAEMLLLDGCLVLFAIFLLRSSVRSDQRPSKLARDGTYGREFIYMSADISYHMKQLRLDLLMLDNQIPFFVVAQLHTQLQTSLFDGIVGKIEEMAISCFDDIHPRCNYNKEHGRFPETIHHLLHLFHWSRSPSGKYGVHISAFVPKEPRSHLPSATELRESATLFRKKPSGSSLDLSFHHSMFGLSGVMSAPALYLYDHSELIFRNLIAFEQHHLRCGLSVTAYSICMARLLQSETDAKFLRKNRILAHTNKTDQEIVHFFKKLSDEYKNTCMPKDLLKLYKDVATHHESRLGRIIGEIMLQYFPNRWITISVICGAIIFFATLASNIYSVYRDYQPLRH